MLPIKPVKESFLPLPSFWWIDYNLWHSLPCRCITLILHLYVTFSLYVSVFTWLSSYNGTSHIGLGSILLHYDLTLTNVCNDPFPNKATFYGTRDQDLNASSLRGHNLIHNTPLPQSQSKPLLSLIRNTEIVSKLLFLPPR